MKVRLLKDLVSRATVHKAGTTIEVAEEKGAYLIKVGTAKASKAKKEEKAEDKATKELKNDDKKTK